MTVLSVEPAANFGSEHGMLVVSECAQPDRVRIDHADRSIYVPDELVRRINTGQVPWAEMTCQHGHQFEDTGESCPWKFGSALKIKGADGLVIYRVTGACGPRVKAYLCEMPD